MIIWWNVNYGWVNWLLIFVLLILLVVVIVVYVLCGVLCVVILFMCGWCGVDW